MKTENSNTFQISNSEFYLQIQLSFKFFSLDMPNDCDSNFVDVYSNNTDLESNREKNFCGSIADTVTSKGNVMYIRFFAEPKARNSSFKILFTAFRETDKSSSKSIDKVCVQRLPLFAKVIFAEFIKLKRFRQTP